VSALSRNLPCIPIRVLYQKQSEVRYALNDYEVHLGCCPKLESIVDLRYD